MDTNVVRELEDGHGCCEGMEDGHECREGLEDGHGCREGIRRWIRML